jgi:hypothetical protein
MNNPLTENINPSKLATDYVGDLKRLIPTIDVAFVGSLIKDVFGVESPVYLPTWWQGREFQTESYPGVSVSDEVEYDDAPVRFGQKTFGAFWLDAGTYKKYDNNGILKEFGYSKFLMPLATIVDFSRPKTVVETPTIGGNGSVKEIIGLEDWAISIKGIILPDPERKEVAFRTVEGQMEAMQSFHEIADSIEVDGQIFHKREISRIVTKSLAFSPVQGKPNMMQYTIDAVSDEDFLLTV